MTISSRGMGEVVLLRERIGMYLLVKGQKRNSSIIRTSFLFYSILGFCICLKTGKILKKYCKAADYKCIVFSAFIVVFNCDHASFLLFYMNMIFFFACAWQSE